MAFWDRWFRRAERKYDTLDLFRDIYGGRTASSGVTVTWARALEVATVLACARVLAEGVAQVPLKLFLDKGNNNREVAKEHSLHWLLYRRPNRWQTSFEFRETVMFHLVLTGNAYVFVGRVGSKREIRELVPLEPQYTTVTRSPDGTLKYTYRPTNGPASEFSQASIWHIRAASWNTWLGLEPVKMAREAIGLAIATESAHAEFHKSGARVSGAYAIDGTLTKERYAFLTEYLDKYAMGGERAGKPLLLDQGAKWLAQQMTGVDAQHIETRKHQIEEICSAMRVMPIMIGHADKTATYASAEQMFIAHVVHTLAPYYERLEQSADANLLTEEETKAGYYVKFLPNGLMRGAAKDRAEFYTRAIGSVNATPAWMTIDEIRALEELPPMGGDAAVLFKPTVQADPADDAGNDNGDETVKHLATEFAKAISDIASGTKALADKEIPAPVINVKSPDVKVDVAAPKIDVHPPSITVEGAKIDVHAHIPKKGDVVKTVTKMDDEGRYIQMTETEVDG